MMCNHRHVPATVRVYGQVGKTNSNDIITHTYAGVFQKQNYGGAWLAHLLGLATLVLGVVSPRPKLGSKITLKIK